ncbi:hypothetical protein B4N89_00780 [Embleya scabrispora]|uniref:Flavin reductase like domain-containing protein n=1 Tax=Embleya scabrispora TaxID=159449 RepID=A0A1T3NSD4_9ACTN|nr:flavin reductase [Embleya scabrispora]OPC79674.1 hypothetical protein B4N89_00780 [Embleya scabrispora]
MHGVEIEELRRVFAQWPSGVAVVTTVVDGARHGMTASSVTSVSLDPPLVSVCLGTALHSHHMVRAGGVFAVNVLGRDQVLLGRRFAGMGRRVADRFLGADWVVAATGAPVLADCVAWLDCTIEHAYPGGDHTIFVGRIHACATPRPVPPLLYHSRDWGQLADRLPERIELADVGLADRLAASGTGEADITRLTRALCEAGVRVRLAPHPPDGRRTTPGGPRASDAAARLRETTSVLVDAPDQVAAAARRDAGTVEVPFRGRETPRESDRTLADIADAAHTRGLAVALRAADAFAPSARGAVLAHVARAASLGCEEVCLDEGRHPASPVVVRLLLQEALGAAGPAAVRVGLREQHGLGLVNALTAMKSGVRLFDTTLGGIDGRLSAEDLLYLAHRLDVPAPADRPALLEAAADLERVWGTELPARTYRTAC